MVRIKKKKRIKKTGCMERESVAWSISQINRGDVRSTNGNGESRWVETGI